MEKQDVHVGLNGWLFLIGGSNDVLKYYQEPGFFSEEAKDEWIKCLIDRYIFFKDHDIKYRHISAPEKISIYPQYFGDATLDLSLMPTLRVSHALANTDAAECFLDVQRPLRDDASIFGTYFRTDTHWNLRGAFVVLRQICSSLGLDIDDDFEQRKFARWKTCFDLGSKLEPNVFEDHLWLPYAPSVRRTYINEIVQLQEEAGQSGKPAPMHHGARVVFYNELARFQKTVVIFGDSFFDHRPGTLTALFAEYFKEIHFCFSHHIDREYCLKVGADIVVSEIAERFMRGCPKDNISIKELAKQRLESFYASTTLYSPTVLTSNFDERGFRITERVRATDAGKRKIAYLQGSRPRKTLPTPVFADQDMTPLIRGMLDQGDETNFKYFNFEKTTLHLYEIDDAYFLIDNGVDNVIITKDKKIILESAVFMSARTESDGSFIYKKFTIEDEFEDVFLGWDSAWHNYYHFLCLGINKAFLARPLFDKKTKIIVPDYESRVGYSQVGYTKETYEQALKLSGLETSVAKLPIGLYKAKKIRFFWPDRRDPSFFDDMSIFDAAFAHMRPKISVGDTPRKLFLSRERHHNPRMTVDEMKIFDEKISRYGFTKVYFEKLSLFDQASLLRNAEAIMAPHGAGLTNIMFGNENLAVREINRDIDGNGVLRPVFFRAAAIRNFSYAYLNQSAGELGDENIDAFFGLR